MKRKGRPQPAIIRALTRWRIPVVTASWMARHISVVQRLLKRGPVLVLYEGRPSLIALSLLDYAHLLGGTGLSVPKMRKYVALVKLHHELAASAPAPGRKRRTSHSTKQSHGR